MTERTYRGESPAELSREELERVFVALVSEVLCLRAEVARLRAERDEARTCAAILDDYASPDAHLR